MRSPVGIGRGRQLLLLYTISPIYVHSTVMIYPENSIKKYFERQSYYRQKGTLIQTSTQHPYKLYRLIIITIIICIFVHFVNVLFSIFIRGVLMFGTLFFSPAAPMVSSVGREVALFSLPFEARPTDPLRREVFRQQPAGQSSWFAPVSVPQVTPQALTPSHLQSSGPLPQPKRRRRTPGPLPHPKRRSRQ